MTLHELHTRAEAAATQTWSRLRQDAGAVIWSGFLAACVACLFFFAAFDPLLLGDDAHPPRWVADRMTGYAVLFFFFWAVTTFAALMTAFLLDTRRDDK
jgi:hypothetical protein